MDPQEDYDVNAPKAKKPKACVELRFLISSKTAGSVIGSSGENIRNLRRYFMAGINISDSNGPERILSLESDLDTIFDILKKSMDKFEIIPLASGDVTESTHCVDLRMLVNQGLMGALIGKGGERISDLRERSNLRLLKIYQSVCPRSTDRIVQMVGNMMNVVDCITNIVELCKHTAIKEPRTNYDANNFDPSSSLHYGGWSQVSDINNKSLGFSTSEFTKGFGGHSNALLLDYNHGSNYLELDVPGNPIGTDIPNPNNQTNLQHIIRLPHKNVGALMGPGGSRIQQIRLTSECQISISPPDRNTRDRTIVISGTMANVRRAQDLIKECLDTYTR